MPIYEFACPGCRTIFSFLGKISDRNRKPACPRCGKRGLGRVPSVFAISSGGSGSRGPGGEEPGGAGMGDEPGGGPFGGPGGGPFGGPGGGAFGGLGGGPFGGPGSGPGEGGDPLDRLSPAQQARMERELGRLMSQAEHLDENNPREMGAFMRRMTEVAGLPKDAAMEEAIRRMEAGEDPERVEEELGDVFGGGSDEGEDGGNGGGYGGFSRDGGMYDF